MRKKRDRWRDYGALRRRKEQVQSYIRAGRSGERWSPGNGECYTAAIAICHRHRHFHVDVGRSHSQLETGLVLYLFPSMAPFDLDACIQQLLRKQLLHEALLREICEKTKEVLMRESNVVHVSAPVTVVGDIHG